MPALLVLALYVVAVQLAFDGGSILPLVPALLAFLLGLLSTLGVTYATELRDRRRLRAQFARFVPASVVDEVVARPRTRISGWAASGARHGALLRPRGFTTAAEAMVAEQVIEVLNHYLTEMSEAILDHGGTVVSYMGDGIMAVFGAPLEQEDHRDRAVAAAERWPWTGSTASTSGCARPGSATASVWGSGSARGL